MGWSKPFSQEEIDAIRDLYPAYSPAEIAEKLGRSKRGVNNKINELGLRSEEREPCARASCPAEDGEPGNRLSRLKELCAMQRTALFACGPNQMAKLSAEYRETLAQIDEIENPAKEGGANDGDELSRLLCSINVRAS